MNYAKIVPCDIANGPSVRVTLFVQGCNHHCPGCQNPTTWDPNGGQPFTDETLDKIVDLLRPDYIQGLTLTGGDPMLPENEPDIAHIIWKVRLLFGDKKDIWVLKLGEGMLLQDKDGKMYKVCDTVEYDETHTDDEVIKVALSEENMIIGSNFFNTSFVFTD